MNPTRALVPLLLPLVPLCLAACGTERPEVATPVAAESTPTPTEPSTGPPTESPTEPPTEPSRASHDLLDDFPLATGWPDEDQTEPGRHYGLKGPGRDRTPLNFEACGEPAPDPAHADRLIAEWANVEDFRARQVTTYDDSRAAEDAVGAFLDHYRGCEVDPGPDDDPYSTRIWVLDSPVGEDSWAVVRASEYDGQPAVGLEVLLVQRVGRAVLIDTAANEGGAGPDRDQQVHAQVLGQADATAEVVEALCDYAEGGCLP